MSRFKIYYKAFIYVGKQIKEDAMLFVAMFAPLFAGVFFHFAIPSIEMRACEYFGKEQIFYPYYDLFDLLLAAIAPIMAGFICAMVMLSERDDGIISYMSVTPLGRKGYFISRVFIPASLSLVASFLTVVIFHIGKLNLATILIMNAFSMAMGILISLFIYDLSGNKVEGMAIGKLSGIIILGIFVPYFITSNVQYLAAVLPSYWLGKYRVMNTPGSLGIGVIVLIVWLVVLYKKAIAKGQ